MSMPRPHWSSRTKIVVSLLLMLVGVYLLYRFSVILTPLVLAVLLAYVLSPLVNFFQRRLRIRRGLSILLAYLVMIAVLTALPMVLIPPLATQSTQFNMDIQRFLRAAESLLAGQYNIAGQVINVDAIFQQAIGSLQGVLEPVFGQTLGFVIDVLTSLVWIIFILVISIYLIKDWLLLRAWLEDLTPPAYRGDFQRLREEINFIWSSFFRGQLVLALVVATIFTTAGFILGLPFALTMGVLAGLLEFFPSVGHGIWLVIASLLALFAGSTWLPLPNWIFMLMIIGLHLVYQQFDLNYLIPRIIGRSVHLHPAIVILGIVAGAVFAGVLGVLLAAPTIASLRVLVRYIYANLFDLDPFQVPVAPPLPPPNPQWWRKTVASQVNRPEN
jgi:predicted PurR-regulated permease PerM